MCSFYVEVITFSRQDMGEFLERGPGRGYLSGTHYKRKFSLGNNEDKEIINGSGVVQVILI